MRAFNTKRYIAGFLITVGIVAVLCTFAGLNFFHGLRLQSSDFLFRAAGNSGVSEQSKNIVVIGIDDKSLEKLGRFTSWPRNYYASVVDILDEAGCRVIVFDVLFSEPATGDAELARSIENAKNVIMPVVVVTTAVGSFGEEQITSQVSTLKPLHDLEKPAAALGYANISADRDGIVREAPIILNINGAYEPSLALAAIQKYLRLPKGDNFDLKDTAFSFAGRIIPISPGNRMVIDYLSSDMDGTLNFQHVSLSDVLESKVDKSIFKDKLVLIGATATGISDKYWTPMGYTLNGVEIHGYTIQTILSADYFSHVPNYLTFLIILILCMLSAIIMLRFRLLIAIPAILVLLIIYFVAAFISFDHGIMLDAFYPPISIVFTAVGISLTNFVFEKSNREEITKIFGRFVTTPVVNEILSASNQGRLNLGGTEQIVTVMFADVRGFTSIMEKTQSGHVINTLNKYLTIVIESVMKYHGIINKFGGDSVMAIWNAPVPCTEHPLMAVRAAYEAQLAISRLKELEPNLVNMSFGIGINTGIALAGNMGCQRRLEYSVIGDTVNVAARLTGITPGGKVWISKTTYEYIAHNINAHYVDSFIFKGKDETTAVYDVTDVK